MNLQEFLASVAKFYFGSSEAAPIVLVLYLIPAVLMIALGYVGMKIGAFIQKKRGYLSKEEQIYSLGYSAGEKAGLSAAKVDVRNAYRKGKEEGIKFIEDRIRNNKEKWQQKNDEKKLEAEKQRQKDRETKKEIGVAFERHMFEILCERYKDRIQDGLTRIVYNINQQGYFDTQIDIVLIDTSGIYLIECKRWGGLIVGNPNWQYWLRVKCEIKLNNVFFRSDNKQRLTDITEVFLNPITQVRNQTEQLERFFTVKKGVDFGRCYKRMAVFNTDMHTDFIVGKYLGKYKDYTWFGKEEELCDAIDNYRSLHPNILTKNSVKNIYDILTPMSEKYTKADISQ